MAEFQLHLVDINHQLVQAWGKAFRSFPEVRIHHANIFDVAEHCVVSPANSYGIMDGGIDAIYRNYFGKEIEHRVMDAISGRPEGYLPVGASLVIATGHTRIPYMIVAPTMLMPEMVEAIHSYRSMRAILRLVHSTPQIARAIYCPGLATGVGMVSAEEAANSMAEAYQDWKGSVIAE